LTLSTGTSFSTSTPADGVTGCIMDPNTADGCQCRRQKCGCTVEYTFADCRDDGVVLDLSFLLGNVTIQSIEVDIAHTWVSDIDIVLTAPDGTTYIPISGDGGADDLGNVTNVATLENAATYVFQQFGDVFESADDETLIPAGTYAAKSWSVLSHDAGLWNFAIADSASGDATCIGNVTIRYCEFRADDTCDMIAVSSN
jgi:hypothetical protein